MFGETELYTHGSFLLGARRALQRRFKVAVPFPFWGGAGLMPHRVAVTAVAGPPLRHEGCAAADAAKAATAAATAEAAAAPGGGAAAATPPPRPRVGIAEPTDEQIDALHARYVEALRAVFEQNKARLGYADATLEIL